MKANELKRLLLAVGIFAVLLAVYGCRCKPSQENAPYVITFRILNSPPDWHNRVPPSIITALNKYADPTSSLVMTNDDLVWPPKGDGGARPVKSNNPLGSSTHMQQVGFVNRSCMEGFLDAVKGQIPSDTDGDCSTSTPSPTPIP